MNSFCEILSNIRNTNEMNIFYSTLMSVHLNGNNDNSILYVLEWIRTVLGCRLQDYPNFAQWMKENKFFLTSAKCSYPKALVEMTLFSNYELNCACQRNVKVRRIFETSLLVVQINAITTSFKEIRKRWVCHNSQIK